MFILYAVVIGIVGGLATGGSLDRLGAFRIRWAPLAIAGLAVQLVLFTPVGEALGSDAASVVYVASTAAVLVVVIRNLRVAGLALVALGASLNLVAIVANGGLMPADPEAIASLGRTADGGISNSVVIADPALRPLTDIFALPDWLPLANVFSIGDVLIGIGVAIAIAIAMRPPRATPDVEGGAGGPGAPDRPTMTTEEQEGTAPAP
jgi:hypothetical protein